MISCTLMRSGIPQTIRCFALIARFPVVSHTLLDISDFSINKNNVYCITSLPRMVKKSFNNSHNVSLLPFGR